MFFLKNALLDQGMERIKIKMHNPLGIVEVHFGAEMMGWK